MSSDEITRREVLALAGVSSGLVAGGSLMSGIVSPAAAQETITTPAPLEVMLRVNGAERRLKLDPRTTLLDALREHLHLTGSKKGCGLGQCGACTVLMDGKRVKSCLSLAALVEGREVTTIEGLAKDGALHPMQEAFRQHHGLQCGFCTPGMIMAAVDLAQKKGGNLDEHTIREGLEGNLCRCTGYHNIVAAVKAGAAAMGSMRQAAE